MTSDQAQPSGLPVDAESPSQSVTSDTKDQESESNVGVEVETRPHFAQDSDLEEIATTESFE